jgi:hypothetical protein
VSFHSYGQYVLHPWGYARIYPNDYADLNRVGQKIANAMYQAGGASYTVGGAAATLYPAAGRIGPTFHISQSLKVSDDGVLMCNIVLLDFVYCLNYKSIR